MAGPAQQEAVAGRRQLAAGFVLVVAGGITAGIALGFGIAELGHQAESGWIGWPVWTVVALSVVGAALLVTGATLRRIGHRLSHDLPDTFLGEGGERQVVEAIRKFERQTSGEIRVHLDYASPPDVRAAAERAFAKLDLAATREHNGVLFYVAVHAHRFAVLGDRGIHEVVPEGFWEEVASLVHRHFATGDFAGGLVAGIEAAGQALARHFPPRADDIDELPDEISRQR